jgi:hypothetical protein
MSTNPALRKDPTDALLAPATFKNDDIQMDLELLSLVNASVGSNNATLSLHTSQIAALQASDSTQTTNITSLQGSVTTLDDDVIDIQGRLATAESDIDTINLTSLPAKENKSEKNQPSGYAGLDANGKIADAQINRAGVAAEGFWVGDTSSAASSRENNFVVYDSVDNKLKPLNSAVMPTFWYPGAVSDAITALQSGKVSWDPDFDNALARLDANDAAIATIQTTSLPAKADASTVSALSTTVSGNTTAISTINTTSLPAKQDISAKNQNNGYVGVDGAGQVAISASNVRRGGMYLTNICRLHIDGADYAPGTNSGTISVWKVITDTFYNYNNNYGAGFKGTTNRTFFKAARDAIISVKGNLAFSIATATNNKFFTLRVTPVNSANTPTPLQYNYGLINGTTGSQSYSFAVDIPMRTGDSLSLEWNLGTAPTFQKDYTYLHISEASNGLSANDWFP